MAGLELARAYITARGDTSRVAGDFNRGKPQIVGAARGIATAVGRAMAPILGMMGIAGTAGAFFMAGREAMGFEKIMIDVRANARLLGEQGATAFSMLEKKAREMGATTQFSAVEAAEALNQLVLGGLTAEQATSSLSTVLNLAASANMGLAESAKVVVDNMVKYRMQASEVGQIADYMSSAQSRAQITARDLAMGLQSVGSMASEMGISFREVTAVLTGMGKSGTEMGTAGTALAMALARLAQQPAEVAGALEEMNIQVGNFMKPGGGVDLIGLFRAIADALPTDPIERGAKAMELFGARGRAILGVMGLMSRGQFVEETFAGLGEDIGRAGVVAEAKMDTFWGSLKEMRSALGELFIAGLTPVLSAMRPFLSYVRDAATTVAGFSDAIVSGVNRIYGFFSEGFGRVTVLGASVIATLVAMKVVIMGLGFALSTAFVIATGPIGAFLALATAIGAVFVDLVGKGDTFGEKMQDIFENKLPGWIEDVQYTLRNFGKILELSVVMAFQNIIAAFPELEKPLENIAMAWQGIWAGMSAFAMNIIDGIRGGIMELWNLLKAIWEGIAAAREEIAALAKADPMLAGALAGAGLGTATVGGEEAEGKDIGRAFLDAFNEELASQEDVQAVNPFEAAAKAFNEARDAAKRSMEEQGGLSGALEARRKELLDSMAATELQMQKERAEAAAKTAEAAKAAKEEGVSPPMKAAFTGRIGFEEYSRKIQDALLEKDEPQKKIAKATEGSKIALESIDTKMTTVAEKVGMASYGE